MEFGKPWKMNPGDGAFYGPKVSIPYAYLKKRKRVKFFKKTVSKLHFLCRLI
jgi:threonyl-tRNA synthetase